ncbi:MAG TPA: amidohydrolase family protein, partial [Thermoanaerobaculia bacterium]|nr:amidohydrolase family protein [Thermoanaerobaculia bacterium]
DKLVRTGATGFVTGYESFAKGAGSGWPDTIEATELHLTPIRPGVVYGTYRYRVRFGADESSGISERVFVETPDGWKIGLTGAIETPGAPPPPRAITGATLIDGRGGAPIANANIIVREGKIECAGADCAVPAGIDVVDAHGLFVTPGLIDAHVHFSQTGWFDGRPDAIDLRAQYPYDKTIAALKASPERFARTYLCSGITSVFDVGGYPWTLQLADRFAKNTHAPHIAAAGPLLSTLDHWLNLPAERQFIHLKDDTARRTVQYVAAQGAKAVKVWYIVNPDLPVAASEPAVTTAGDEARKLGLPLIVHATGLAEAKAALRAGAKLLVHSVSDAPVDDELIALLKKNDAVLTPTLTVLRGYVRGAEAILNRTAPAIDDPNKCVDPATMAKVAATATLDPSLVTAERIQRRVDRMKATEAIASPNLKRLVDAGVPIATGTDAGNPLTLHGPAIYAELDAMQAAGMTPMQVIVASTATAARAMGMSEVTGTIEKGKDADLLLLSADPSKDVANFRKIKFVVRGGVIRGIEELSALAQRDN